MHRKTKCLLSEFSTGKNGCRHTSMGLSLKRDVEDKGSKNTKCKISICFLLEENRF